MSVDGLSAVPHALLAPLAQAAGEVLRGLAAQDAPPALRPLLGFDRRGFASAAARAQLLRAVETDDAFRQKVVEAFSARDEVRAVLAAWEAQPGVAVVHEAMARDDLPLVASTLYASRPEGWELGLGVVVGVFEADRERRAADDDRKALDTRLAGLEERVRRADAARREAEAAAARLEEELKAERGARRAREEHAEREAVAERERAHELAADLARLRDQLGAAEARAGREVARAAELDEALRTVRGELAEAQRALGEAQRSGRTGRVVDASALAEAAGLARRLANELDRLTGREPAGAQRAARAPDPARTRRVRVPVPPGHVGTSAEGLRATLSTGDVRLVVDGYNVSMQAWAGDAPDVQRQRLCALLERLHLRSRTPVTVVFDGADVEGVRPPHRPGVRVIFSDPGEEADAVVVREVAAAALDVPVVVVSSDAWVREHAEAEGALVVASEVFLEVLRHQ